MFIESSPGNDNAGTLLDTRRFLKPANQHSFCDQRDSGGGKTPTQYGLPATGQSSVLMWAIMRDLEKARANRRERGGEVSLRG